MRDLRLDQIYEIAQKDVVLVKREAKLVLEITPEGTVKTHCPENRRLDIIAVIGPVENSIIPNGKTINNAVLLEIGIRRAKPYHELSNRFRKQGESGYFPIRKQWFALSQEQYIKVFPIILRILQKMTNNRAQSWKCITNNDPYIIPVTRHWFSRNKKRVFLKKRYIVAYPKGIRFSIAIKDELIVRYIYWAELHLNNRVKRHLQGLANFLNMVLSEHKGYKRNFSNLKSVKEINDMFYHRKPLPQYQLEEIIERYLPQGYKNPLVNEIIDLLGYNRKISEERLLAASAIPFSYHQRSIPQIIITTGLDKNKDHIVFEMSPDDTQ